MLLSNLGVILMLVFLGLAAMQWSLARVLCVYGLPYLVINAWLVGYTWLHHTDLNIPHYNAWRGTALLSQRFPLLVRHDPTPIHQALWRVASRCSVVSQVIPGEGFFYQA